MKYNLFLFDLDDTLLDFKESERLSFFMSLQSLGIKSGIEEIYPIYQKENNALWKLFEQGKTTKDHLKVERFKKTFDQLKIEIDPQVASTRYLETLPETVVLLDHAIELCEWIAERGELGIITNGIHAVQDKRIKNSKLAQYISFVSVSEMCGYAKPDVRFFEYSSQIARNFKKENTIIVGDRLEADILGAMNFGIDSCWFNPHGQQKTENIQPTFEISHLSEFKSKLV